MRDQRQRGRAEQQSILGIWAAMLGLAGAVVYIVPYIAGGDVYLSLFSDDFYYYFVVAENIANGHGSTFNGLVSTNGYHPLWLAIISVLAVVGNAVGVNPVFLVSVLLTMLSFWYLRLLRQFIAESSLAILMLSANYISYLYLAMSGMEVALLLPLMLYFIWRYQKTDTLNYYAVGFLASLVVLTRVDTALFILLYLIFDKLRGTLNWTRLVKFGLGGFLIPVYVIANQILFGTAMPVSGKAKTVLEMDLIPHVATFNSFFQWDLPTTLLNGFIIAVWVGALIGLRGVLKTLDNKRQVVLLSVVFFIPLYYYTTSVRSDWPMWRWYFYPLTLFLVVFTSTLSVWIEKVLALVCRALSIRSIAGGMAMITSTLVMLGVFGVSYYPKLTQINERHYEAQQLQDFSKTHPGVYGIGDRAGLAAYLIRQPVVQLEGLMMDVDYLHRLETAADLNSLLTSYNVDYYVSFTSGKSADDCYKFNEPKHSAGESRKITSILCWPVARLIAKRRSGGYVIVVQNPRLPRGDG